MPDLVTMTHISKAYAGNQALSGVSLSLQRGTVHALMGENGAGKSTLMKILAGVVQPDNGTIHLNGSRIQIVNPKDALRHGISTVFQELSLLPNLTIAENMFLGREPKTRLGFIDYPRMRRETRQALMTLGLSLDPDRLVSELSIAERQFVEIAHGIDADASVFILDEPTAALNAADVEVLNRQISRLKDQGKAIVYISHRMEEIFTVCDTVTVLKDGVLVGTRLLSEMTPNSLVAMMVGRQLQDLFPPHRGTPGDIALEINDMQIEAASRPLSLAVRKGEIVALAGLEGQGQGRIVRSLIGKFHPYRGSLAVKGKRIELPLGQDGVRAMLRLNVGFVPEDRKDEGLFLGLPIAHNIVMTLHSRRSELALAKNYQSVIAETMARMRIKAAGSQTQVSALSGGNQQKVLLGRYLVSGADVLLIEEPTRGVDIGAKVEIYKLLREFADRGGAIIVLSRETLELIGLCDRICVVHHNTIVAEMQAAEATEHRILNAALVAA